jgi:multiple sugar transport system permease protein
MASPARDRLTRLAAKAALAAALAWAAIPLVWALICSIKRPLDVFSLSVIPWLQFEPTLAHWREEWASRGPELRAGLINSTLVATVSSALAVGLAAPAAYALARLSTGRQRRFWWLWLISQRFLPPVVLIAPYFLLFKALGMLDSRLALILVHAVMHAPLAALLLQDAFAELPPDLEEAAMVDGAGRWRAFASVALPLSAPAVAAAAVLCAAYSWNEFLLAVTLTYRDAVTMPVLIAGTEHTQGVQFWYVATRSLLALIPPAILAVLAQRYLIRGLTMGAVKG